MTSRRLFVQIVPISCAGLLVACSDKAPPPAPVAVAPAPVPAAAPAPAPAPAPAAAPPAAPAAAAGPMVDEKDAVAVALGYVAEASRVDKVKYTQFAVGQATHLAPSHGIGLAS